MGEVAPALGLAERYAGHRGYVQAWHDYTRDMGSLRVVPEELIDLGKCLDRLNDRDAGAFKNCVEPLSRHGLGEERSLRQCALHRTQRAQLL